MIRFIENLYVGDLAARKKKTYIRMIRKGKSQPDLYIITYAASGRDMLDILPTRCLHQKFIRDRLPEIVGIAVGKEEAIGLFRKMVRDCFRKTGGCNVKEYLQSLDPFEEET